MKRIIVGVAVALVLTSLPTHSATPPKAGATCFKSGSSTIYLGKKFTCIKSGKKLVWSKGVPQSSNKDLPNSAPSPGPSSSQTSQSSNQDSGVIPEFQDVKVSLLGANTAKIEFKATGYRSYKISVVLISDPNRKDILSTSVINDFAPSMIAQIGNLECNRSNYFEVRATIFSGRDGNGSNRVAGDKVSTLVCDSYKEPSRVSKNFELCKVKEVSAVRKRMGELNTTGSENWAITGFPKTESKVSSKGTIRFIAIPIDWSDLPGEANFASHWNEQFGIFTEWLSTVSEGKLKADITLHGNWIRMSGSSNDYKVPFSEAAPQSGDFWKKALPSIDPLIDFTNYQFVIFVLPSGQKIVTESIQQLYASDAIKDNPPKEGKILAYMGAGMYFENWNVKQWSYLAHEVGHLIDFAHGGSGRDSGPMGGYDIMFSQDGPSRTFSGWWRFLANWLEPSQIFCDDVDNLQDVNLSLVPIDSSAKGIKVAILRVSPTKVLVIESRRYSKFDNDQRQAWFQKDLVKEDWNGLIVYEYNAELGHLGNFFIPVASNTALSEYNWDGTTRYIVKESEVVENSGVKITLKNSGNFDAISVTKLSASEILKPRPTPSPAPSPTVDDFDVEPNVGGGAQRTSTTTGVSTWYGKSFRSYRIYVVNAKDPNSMPLFDTGIINDYRSPVVVNLRNLTCSRDLLEVGIFYSGLDGKGKFRRNEQSAALSAVNISGNGECQGYWTNGAVGKG